MKDVKTIVTELGRLDFQKKKAAIATVVRVRGSSYRSPGARMLITDDGRWFGSISGGCLEGDALRKARQVMTENKARTVTYDTREESNQNLGISLGCNGVIDVLLEPIDEQANLFSLLHSFAQSNKIIALATIFSNGQGAGEKIMLTEDGEQRGELSDAPLQYQIVRDLALVFQSRKSEVKAYQTAQHSYEVFLELIQPMPSVIIFGGGFDARPVSELATSLGWNVVVTDECVAHLAPVFFPTANQLSLCQREFIDRDFDITPYSACILMSHNYEYDRDVLKKLLQTSTSYIGILGPRKRFDKMINDFSQNGIILSEFDHQRIHSPIGLDIGAEAPDEIAISIIAEIQSKFANRTGGYLKHLPGPIHERETNSDQILKQPFHPAVNPTV